MKLPEGFKEWKPADRLTWIDTARQELDELSMKAIRELFH